MANPTPAQHMSAARRALDRMLADTRRQGVPDVVVVRAVADVLGGPLTREHAAAITALRRELDDTRAALTREQTATHHAHNVARALRAELDAVGRPTMRLD